MSEITSPIMLDDTGQDLVAEAQNIVTKLQALINAVKPTAADIPLAAISGMTADDVQEGVAELKSNLTNIGTFYSYSWTANSSNAYGAQLTQAVTLPKGVYILIGVAPILSVTNFTLLLSANKSINAPFQFNAIRNRTPISFTFQVTEDDTNVWISAGGSTSVSYSNISEGSGRIVRVSN